MTIEQYHQLEKDLNKRLSERDKLDGKHAQLITQLQQLGYETTEEAEANLESLKDSHKLIADKINDNYAKAQKVINSIRRME
jgi:hypothetical protein